MLSLDRRRAFGPWFFIAIAAYIALYFNDVSYIFMDEQGDALATLHLNRMELAEGAIARMQQAVRLTSEKPATPPLVYAAVSPEGVAR